MKNLFRNITMIIIALGITLGQSFGSIQESNSKKNQESNFDDCVKVLLIADNNSYELKKDNLISVIVRIINTSDERLKLSYAPIFEFEKIGIKEEEKSKPILGNYYTGRIVAKISSKSEDLFLEKGGYLDFIVNINDLELKDGMDSMDIWLNIFKMLRKGEYNMHAEAFIIFPNSEKTDAKQFLSNKITISYAE